ncbi:hypothetical protein C8Q74DRAFT_1362812 [Fomes fomentarius]|nr:hypothetical protein C8Q74DRAFT_1362812 [Fomes fomentarius]
MILLPPDGPLAQQPPHFVQSHPGPSAPPPTSFQPAVISPEDDVQRLFNVCKVGQGNAELLNEVLVYANPQELRDDVTKDLLGRARASHELIGSQIPWATTEAEKSRQVAGRDAKTIQEQLLAALLGAYEQLTECLKMHEDLERVAIEQEAEERIKTERLIQALTAVSEYRPSSEEAPLIEQVFSTGDPEHTGKINPQTATRIFSASNLPPDALARIWEIASVDSKEGLLDRQGVGVALRLIGHAQGGAAVTEALVARLGPLAVLESISPVPVEHVAGPSKPTTFGELPPLTGRDKTKFRKIFKASGAQNGILSGKWSKQLQARDVFIKSRLPWNTLREIWQLADVRRRGYIDTADFTIAMYLIQALMTGKLSSVPTTLPQQLYEEAARYSSAPDASDFQPYLPPPTHPSRAPSSPSPFAGPPPPRHPSSRPSSSRGHSPSPSPSFDISAATRVQANHIFSSLDPRNKGRISGDAFGTYIQTTGLSTNAINRIRDMVDIGHKGYLTRDEFIVAMHLVKVRKDGYRIPSVLPRGVLRSNDYDDAFGGIAVDSPMHLDPYRGTSASSSSGSRHSSHSEHRSRASSATPGPSTLRSSRSTPHLALTTPISSPSPPSSSAGPFPMSPLPGPMNYTPSQPTSPAQWNIKPEERVKYDQQFDQLDTGRKNYLLSDVAVPFFARAQLPNDVMATIWDLADSEHDGRLTRDDFAVAVHLIRQKLAGKELPTSSSASCSLSATVPLAEPQPQRRDSGQRPSLPQRSSSGPHNDPQPDPTTVRLPDDLDDDIRSDTPPPPYELIVSGTA